MNLSPLPRSNSSLTTMSTSPPTMNYNYYPASPPPSHPSSPTSSSRISSTSTSSTTWHRHDGNALTDIASNFLNNEYSSEDYHQHYLQKQQYPPHSLISTGRSQSQSAAIEANRHTNAVRPPLPTNQNRLRSQSSPNIMKDDSASIVMTPSESLPQVPTLRTKPAPLDLSREPAPPQLIRNVASTPRLTDIALSHGGVLPPSPGTIKIKLVFNDGIYVIVTNHEVAYFELMEKVDKKIRLVANLKQSDLLRLKYQDEDCDFITINSDDDVQMAFESRGVHNTVNLFVSL
jgi:cell division control protein 24